MSWREYLPNTMRAQIASQEYQNAESDINRFQNLNQSIESYRNALKDAQQAKFIAGEEYIAAVNASRAASGKEPYAGWPEEAMGNSRRVYPAIDRMGYPLTPQQEAMYAQASPRRVVQLRPEELSGFTPSRVVQLTPEELAAFNAQRNAVDTSYSGSGGDFGVEQPVQAVPVAAQPAAPQQQEAAPMYPEREHELRRQDLRAKVLATNQLMDSLIAKNRDYAETIRSSFKNKLEALVDPEQMKSFDESNAAKSVWAELPSLRKERDFVKTIREDILQAEKIRKDDPENKVRLVNSLQTILPKMIQSAASGGSDAVQMQEFMKLAPELVNGYSEYAASIGKDPLSSGTYFQWLNSNQFKKTADPEAFIQKVKEKYNVIASARNSVVEEFQNRTSPEWFSKTGVKMLPIFKSDIESEMAGAKPSKLMPDKNVQSLLEKYK
jgi:hypothetical protein